MTDPVITVRRVYGRTPDIWVYDIDGVESRGVEGVGYFRSSERAVAAAEQAGARIKGRAEREVTDLLRDDVLEANRPR